MRPALARLTSSATAEPPITQLTPASGSDLGQARFCRGAGAARRRSAPAARPNDAGRGTAPATGPRAQTARNRLDHAEPPAPRPVHAAAVISILSAGAIRSRANLST